MNQSTSNAKLFAVMAYFPFLWLAGMFVEPDKDDPLVRYHVNQGIILTILYAVVWVLTKLFFLFGLLYALVLALFILGVINAASGQMRPLPIIGNFILYR